MTYDEILRQIGKPTRSTAELASFFLLRLTMHGNGIHLLLQRHLNKLNGVDPRVVRGA